MGNRKNVYEILHFLDVEIEISRERLERPYLDCFDGIIIKPENAKDDRVRRLYESHIRFCEQMKSMIIK